MQYEPTINYHEQKHNKMQAEKVLQIAKQKSKKVTYYPQGYSPTWQKMKEEAKTRNEAKAEASARRATEKKESKKSINRRRAIELYNSGKSVTEIMAIMDFSRGYINELLRGVLVYENVSKAMREKAFEMQEKGMSIKEIAKELGAKYKTVWGYLKKGAK